jgi:fatty-acyl-CoA synthase
VYLHKSFSPEAWLRTVQDHQINFGLLVPTMLYAILDSEHIEKFDLSSIETIVYGAAPMSPTRLAEAHQKIGNVFVQVYAQSECASIATTLASNEHDPVNKPHLLKSCGKASVGATVILLDDDGKEVPDGVPGEICVRGRTVMTEYWRNPELTAETLKDGWLHTGDMAVRDAEGFLFIVDRKKDMIISGGMNIFPKEIEDVLSQHPKVAIASVIGIPDDKWGEAVTAIIVCRPGESVEPNELMEMVKTAKGPHQTPKSIYFVDALPMTPVGKVDKKALKEQFKNIQGEK